MDNDSQVTAHADRPEIRVFSSFQLVKLQSGTRGVQLKVERSSFCGFLLLAGQPRKTIREGVRYSEFHAHLIKINNSPDATGPRRVNSTSRQESLLSSVSLLQGTRF